MADGGAAGQRRATPLRARLRTAHSLLPHVRHMLYFTWLSPLRLRMQGAGPP